MRESYKGFTERVSVFERRELDLGKSYFKGKPSLAYKINEFNQLKSFFGDTVVFELSEEEKTRVGSIVNEIYEVCPECFAEKLKESTLHMTLHDLSNSPEYDDVSLEMEKNAEKIRKIIDKVGNVTIKMKASFIFNMVNTSLVLGLIPLDEGEYEKLMRLYYLIDESVKKAEYPLTPHITLGYYNINGFNEEAKSRLEKLIYKLNDIRLEIILDTQRLFYQRFFSMNDYRNIIKLA